MSPHCTGGAADIRKLGGGETHDLGDQSGRGDAYDRNPSSGTQPTGFSFAALLELLAATTRTELVSPYLRDTCHSDGLLVAQGSPIRPRRETGLPER